jgi:LAO/AO transport system kinase
VARDVLDRCLPDAGDARRIAVTGVPGVGKSTFIEALGTRLVKDGGRLAVLTIDPSSERSGGAILGDKTRMSELAAHDRAFVRPSPTGGTLGGVAAATRESILLCEAAGFDTVFVETVGVGQSEGAARSMVDVFVLLALPGAGDELQGMKRGIIELADVIAVNKADGDRRAPAEQARVDIEQALHLFPPPPSGARPDVLTCSAHSGDGLGDVWKAVRECFNLICNNGYYDKQRREQRRHWMRQTVERLLRRDFYDDPNVRERLAEIEDDVASGTVSPPSAAETLLALYRRDEPST